MARITEETGNVIEQSLMVWQEAHQLNDYPLSSSVLSYPGLEIKLNQRRVLRNGKHITLSKYEYGVLVFWCSWHDDLVGYAVKNRYFRAYGMKIAKAV